MCRVPMDRSSATTLQVSPLGRMLPSHKSTENHVHNVCRTHFEHTFHRVFIFENIRKTHTSIAVITRTGRECPVIFF